MINSHIHIFRDKDVPVKFLPLHLVRFLSTKIGFKIVAKVLNFLNPISNDDLFNRYVKFMTIGSLGSQEKILNECQKYYPDGTKFVILPMDMSFMKAGKVPRNYMEQLEELSKLKKTNDNILPFVHTDPRRNNILDILKQYIEVEKFSGVKVYPSLGYFPYDERMYPIYKYCEENGIPIMSHCAPLNQVHYRGSKKEVLKMLSGSKIKFDTKGKSVKELCSYFSHPSNWEFVMKDFPKLKICLGHFGGEYYWTKYLENPEEKDNWFSIIKSLIRKYDNLYTDLSFTMNDDTFFSILKILLLDETIKNKVLFGSDFYMVETATNEKRFSMDLRAYLGEDNFNFISDYNPKKYLNIK